MFFDITPTLDSGPDTRQPILMPPVTHDGWRWWLDPVTNERNIWHEWAGWIALDAPTARSWPGWRYWVWYGHVCMVDELERLLRQALLDSEARDAR